jgi:glutamate racemase
VHLWVYSLPSSESDMEKRIGVFDSGVGGLSILQEIKSLLPQESFVYVADQLHMPYGGKTKQELEELSEKIVSFLIQKDVKLVVVACNTATVYALESLREKFDLPIVGVVPVIKKIAETTNSGKIGILATPATSESQYLKELIDRFAPDKEVYNIGTTGLEELVEQGIVSSPEIDAILKHHLEPLIKAGVDALALGCTHYPFIKDQIKEFVGGTMQVIDSGSAVARQVKKVLENNQAFAKSRGEDFYYTTGDRTKFCHVAEKLLHQKLDNVEGLQLN